MIKQATLIAAGLLLAGCSSQTLKEVGRAPDMSPVGAGLAYASTPEMAMYPKKPPHRASTFSLWDDRQSKLFTDARANAIGDILTVDLQVNDQASFDNATDRSRVNSSGISAGVAIPTFGAEGEGSVDYGSNTSTSGAGSTVRSEKLQLKIAAVVTGILQNGNLVISGSQEVRVNHELRILNIAGIVRPQDVDHNNTVAYDKIAEARVSYGGRGRLTEVQQPPVGQQLIDILSPI
ncbi:flagellar basal body L-ring protein FlgH [Pseudohoeflea coraliihabitans]|uniref:Flagellar L-ring protein n=1 Tax=Pseudohoeflea coraliihabitans TaxID=2860393 RepID=A0ABS6WN27_9HYPH|nr:flagellar basal body L-ring protein FlgH [Pseudohoeflea sp. DP4N28-3]MBW3097367.1 flagellar basal body L-ring protein FlgH [Pseudohoeflea sp. DP4N28-3]